MAQREPPAADPGDAAAEDVELLAGDRSRRRRRGRRSRCRACRGWYAARARSAGFGAAAARLRDGAIRTTGLARGRCRRPLPRRPRPASSANVTSDSGTSGSPRRTRARYSPVAEPVGRRDLLGRALGDDPAAAVAALRPEVDDPVGGLDDVEVVLDDEDRVAAVDQPVEHLEQLLDVGEVEAGRRLVEDVQRPAGRPPRQLGRQLDPLRLAARQRRRRLAEVDVAEADVVERLELGPDVRARPRRSRAPRRSSSRGRRRSTCPCSGSRAPRGCSACRLQTSHGT